MVVHLLARIHPVREYRPPAPSCFHVQAPLPRDHLLFHLGRREPARLIQLARQPLWWLPLP